eukprot:TRINITY_DN1140_c0_g1_i4.p1 TRINITY_DN1140_c0_g1~~TRINITY_DN1140_c0_g1_i4.p1  ORF type:complete len:441 (+),score=41.34 TRINITY_DN1140_c0_g1_i4:51-1373(+)
MGGGERRIRSIWMVLYLIVMINGSILDYNSYLLESDETIKHHEFVWNQVYKKSSAYLEIDLNFTTTNSYNDKGLLEVLFYPESYDYFGDFLSDYVVQEKECTILYDLDYISINRSGVEYYYQYVEPGVNQLYRKYSMNHSSKYTIFLYNCKNGDLIVDGSITWKNNHGYLDDINYVSIEINIAFSIIYLQFFLYWMYLLKKYESDLLQKLFLFCPALLFVVMVLKFSNQLLVQCTGRYNLLFQLLYSVCDLILQVYLRVVLILYAKDLTELRNITNRFRTLLLSFLLIYAMCYILYGYSVFINYLPQYETYLFRCPVIILDAMMILWYYHVIRRTITQLQEFQYIEHLHNLQRSGLIFLIIAVFLVTVEVVKLLSTDFFPSIQVSYWYLWWNWDLFCNLSVVTGFGVFMYYKNLKIITDIEYGDEVISSEEVALFIPDRE